VKPMPWSHTALDDFINCPRQYYEKRIAKSVKEEKSEQMIWGEWVHKQFEDRQAKGTPLPVELTPHEEYMKRLEDMPGKAYTERKVALNVKAEPCQFFDKDVWCRGIIDYTKVAGNKALIVDYKGLPVDTLISTPTGFVRMGDLCVGDLVHASDGLAYPVLVKSQPLTRPCFEITFDDKTKVVCDNVHLWSLVDGTVVPVTELTKASKIPVAHPVSMSVQQLPIDPYVLGLWLADGKHTSAEISKPDEQIWSEVSRRGYQIGVNTGKTSCVTRTVKGIRAHLTNMGLFRNKHIPLVYLQGSIQQRVDLLRGLMDGDGSVNPLRKQVVFQNTNKQLSDDVKLLVESLGCRVNQATVTYTGFGCTGTAYPLSWRPRWFNPFLLQRKAARVGVWGDGQSWYRRVIAVTPVSDMTTQCIGVGSPDNTYLCTSSRIVTHNTGKMHSKFKQLKLFALNTFAMFPDVFYVDVRYYWTQHQQATGEQYTRAMIPQLWSAFTPDLRQYVEAFKTDTWQPRPSGLCAGWCPVTECEFWKPKRNK
jgi:hypothetical protein